MSGFAQRVTEQVLARPAEPWASELERLRDEPVEAFVFVDFADEDALRNPEEAAARLLGGPSYARFVGSLDVDGVTRHVDAWFAHVGLGASSEWRDVECELRVLSRVFPRSNRVNLSCLEQLTRLYYGYLGRLTMRLHDFPELDARNVDSVVVVRATAVISALTHLAAARRALYLAAGPAAPTFSLDSAPLTELNVTGDVRDGDRCYKHMLRVMMGCQVNGYTHRDEWVYRRKCDAGRLLPYYERFCKMGAFFLNYLPETGGYDPTAEPTDFATLPNVVDTACRFGGRVLATAKTFEQLDTAAFPLLKPRRELYCLRNGVYDVDADSFTPHGASRSGFCVSYVAEDWLDEWDVSRGGPFFRCGLDPRQHGEAEIAEAADEWLARGEDPDLLDPMSIPTPALDLLLDYQWHDAADPDVSPAVPKTSRIENVDVVRRFFFAMLGRMLHPVGQLDRWQVFSLLIGYANTGKSLVIKALTELIGVDNVGVLSSTTERGWELSGGLETKLAVLCPELGQTHNLPITDLLQMAAGEPVQIKNKNVTQVTVRWPSHLFFSGNRMATWPNTKNNLLRRQFVWMWDRPVALNRRDESLEQRLLSELAPLLVKANRMYLALVRHMQDNGIKSLFRVIPAYNVQCSVRALQAIDPLRAFFESGALVFDKSFVCPLEVMRGAFERYCREHSVRVPELGTGDSWLSELFGDYSLSYCADASAVPRAKRRRGANSDRNDRNDRGNGNGERGNGNGERNERMDADGFGRGAGPDANQVTLPWPDYLEDETRVHRAAFIAGVGLHPREWRDDLERTFGVTARSLMAVEGDRVKAAYRCHFEPLREMARRVEELAGAGTGPTGAGAFGSFGVPRECVVGVRGVRESSS